MSSSELRAAVEELQHSEPDLNRFGYGGNSAEPLNLEAVAWCVNWLKEAPTGKRATVSSYAMKHLAENLRVREQASDSYVGNGDLIAAARLVGVPLKRNGAVPEGERAARG